MTTTEIGSYDKFQAYRAVIMQAVALAWRDAAFKAELKSDPKGTLLERFGYRFPFRMDVEVIESGAEWRPSLVGDWLAHTENFLEMVLPPAPAQAADRAEALAAYNANHIDFLEC
jgi:ribosomally synthesized peptide (two-chain TOMM family)